VRVAVKVVPRAARDEIVGWAGDRLRVRVTAAPEGGRANAALEALLAVTLGLPRSRVRVVAGHASPRKLVEVDGLTAAQVDALLPRPG